MNIPGENILDDALTIIESQSVNYFSDNGRTRNPAGGYLTGYAAPVTISEGSVQPVPRSRYQALGFDWAKNYVTWFVPWQAITVLERSKSGDVFEWSGGRYQCLNDQPWFPQDGWAEITGVYIGPATGATTNA